MVRLSAVIETDRWGRWRWYAYLRLVPQPGGLLRKSVQLGKLAGPRTGSLASCRSAIRRTATRLGGVVARIDCVELAFGPDGREHHVVRRWVDYRSKVEG